MENLDKNVFSGERSLARVLELVQNYKSPLLIYDKISFSLCGAANLFQKLEGSKSLNKIGYTGKALPIEDVQSVFNEILEFSPIDLVIAIGGGTIIDLAKILSLAYSNKIKDLNGLLQNQDLSNHLDLVFIPTTAGTGSEATSFAVVYKDKIKHSIMDNSLLPKYTILDPFLLHSLPDHILHSTLLDALSQGIESMWAVGATEESREYSRQSIQQVLKGLKEKDPTTKLTHFQWGSYFSGKAINISKTTMSHAISYPLTAHFGIPHGTAVFLTLPQIALLNYEASEEELQDGLALEQKDAAFKSLFELFEVSEITELARRLREIMTDLEIKQRLSDYGLTRADLDPIVGHSFTKGRSNNNPRKMDSRTIYKLLEGIL